MVRLCAVVLFALLAATQLGYAQSPPAVPKIPVESVELPPPATRSHAIAMHGSPKYPAGFSHFDYVNPDAPKGGTLRRGVQGTFDSFNPFIAKGNPGAGSSTETLLVSSADEAFTEYGLIAESLEWPEDRSWVIFTLRPEARWHDGRPISVEDVIWSLETLKAKGAPFYRFYYGNVAAAEKIGDRRVKFTFTEAGNRELPLIVGQLPILPKHYWEARDFESTTLEPPLGSGPHRVVDFEPGRFVVVERVENYWGKDLAVTRGQDNFDRIRYDYFRDAGVIRQALKAGDIDYREENTAKAWATEYDTPAWRDGRLKTVEFPHQRPTGMQAFVFNTRLEKFSDPRLRKALAYAFDFEWTNRNLFYQQYTRSESYFSNSELASTGLPEGAELELLEAFRGRIPDSVFTTPYRAPATDGSGWPRENLARAFELLAEAGWVVRDLKLVDPETGRQLRLEFLIVSPAFERIVLPLARNLGRLGIDARVRLVDQSQYINRLRSYDFEIVVGSFGQSDSPGNEQRSYWGSAAADQPGNRNYAGIKDPAVDELIELVITAPDREALVTRTRALDRVLLHNYLVIPNWHLKVDRLAFWDKFSWPEVIPRNGTSVNYWWFDPGKAARAEAGGAEAQSDGGRTAWRPGVGVTAVVAAGALVLGVVLFRWSRERNRA